MTPQEWAAIATQVGGGIFGGIAQGQQNRQDQQNQRQQELDAAVQRMMASLQNAQQTGQNLQMNRQQMPQTQAELSPLGQEQSFLQKQRMLQTLLPTLAGFQGASPTDPGVAGAYRPQSNILAGLNNPKLLEAVGDSATAQSLADRRKLMAQINPDYEFSSLGGFGLDPSFDQGVNRASQDAGARLRAYESAQSALADQQIGLSNDQLKQAQLAGQQQQKQGGGGVKGFLGGLLKTAAPFANFIPGVGPIAAIGLGAAGGALGNKLQGGGLVSGAVQGGIGAGIGAAGKSLASGQGLNPFNNGAAGGKMLDAAGKAVTSASQVGPQMSEMAGSQFMNSPSFASSAPYNAAGDIQSLLQQPQSSFRQLPASNVGRVVTGVGGPKPSAPQPFTNPPRTQGIPTRNVPPNPQAVGQNLGEKSLWDAATTSLLPGIGNTMRSAANYIDQPTLPPTDYPMVNQAIAMMKGGVAGALGGLNGQTGMFTQGLAGEVDDATSPLGIAGLATGGAFRGAKIAQQGVKAAQAAPTPLAQALKNFPTMAGKATPSPIQALGANFPGVNGGPAALAEIVNPAEHAIAEGMMAMGRMGKQMPSTGNAINQSLQRFYKQVPGQVTESISPQMLQQIVTGVKAPARAAARTAKAAKKVKK